MADEVPSRRRGVTMETQSRSVTPTILEYRRTAFAPLRWIDAGLVFTLGIGSLVLGAFAIVAGG